MALGALDLLELAEAPRHGERAALDQHRIGGIGAGFPGALQKVGQQVGWRTVHKMLSLCALALGVAVYIGVRRCRRILASLRAMPRTLRGAAHQIQTIETSTSSSASEKPAP